MLLFILCLPVNRKSTAIFSHQQPLHEKFLQTDLGKLYVGIPFEELGNEKNHCFLHKIPARNQITETCWIFFGVMTSNAIKIAKRITASMQQSRAA